MATARGSWLKTDMASYSISGDTFNDLQATISRLQHEFVGKTVSCIEISVGSEVNFLEHYISFLFDEEHASLWGHKLKTLKVSHMSNAGNIVSNWGRIPGCTGLENVILANPHPKQGFNWMGKLHSLQEVTLQIPANTGWDSVPLEEIVGDRNFKLRSSLNHLLKRDVSPINQNGVWKGCQELDKIRIIETHDTLENRIVIRRPETESTFFTAR